MLSSNKVCLKRWTRQRFVAVCLVSEKCCDELDQCGRKASLSRFVRRVIEMISETIGLCVLHPRKAKFWNR